MSNNSCSEDYRNVVDRLIVKSYLDVYRRLQCAKILKKYGHNEKVYY